MYRKEKTGMKHTKVIGLTGGVGSGKSTIGKWMAEKFGITLVVSDEVGHLCMEPGEEAYHKIIENFGEHILQENGKIDRKKLSTIVFEDEEKLKQLNNIIHPAVRKYIENKIKEVKEKQEAYFVLESAILLQAGFGDICDETWYVQVSEQTRRERLKTSRGYSDEKIDSILRSQWSDAEFIEKTDKRILNEGDFGKVVQQIEKLLEQD